MLVTWSASNMAPKDGEPFTVTGKLSHRSGEPAGAGITIRVPLRINGRRVEFEAHNGEFSIDFKGRAGSIITISGGGDEENFAIPTIAIQVQGE